MSVIAGQVFGYHLFEVRSKQNKASVSNEMGYLVSTVLIEITPSSFVTCISYESHVERNSFGMENDSQNVLNVAKNKR